MGVDVWTRVCLRVVCGLVLCLCLVGTPTTYGVLVAYYNFDNATATNVPVQQGYCPSRADIIAGTWTGRISLTTGKFGQGASFSTSTSNQYISLGNWNINSQVNQLSITAWVNPTAPYWGVSVTPRIVSKESSSGVVWALMLTFSWSTGWVLHAEILFQGSSSATTLTATSSVPSGTWTHVGVTFDGKTITLYENGAAIATSLLPNIEVIDETQSNVPIEIGSGAAKNGYPGIIDEVKIFDTALSASDMQALATATGPNLPPVFNSTSSATNPTQIPGGSLFILPAPPVTDPQEPTSQLQFNWEVVSGGCSGVNMLNTSSMDLPVELTLVQAYTFQVTARDNELCSSANVYVTAIAVPPAIDLGTFPNGTAQVQEGSTATFTVNVISGFPTPTIQWQQLVTITSRQTGNITDVWQDIPGATSATFTTPVATSALDGTEYRVVVRNFMGFYASEPIVIAYVPSVTGSTSPSGSSTGSGGSGDGGTIAGIVVGSVVGALALCLLAACAVAMFILYKRQSGLRRRIKLVKPDFEPLNYGDRMEEPQLKKAKRAKLEELEELLLRPDNQLLFAITGSAKAGDMQTLCPALVYVYEAHGKSYNLLETCISLEVSTSDEEGTLFRSNSLAMRLFQPYSRIFGSEWLWNTLALPINELNNLSAEEDEVTSGESVGGHSLFTMSLEIDPTKMEDASDAEVKTLQLWLIAQKLFTGLVKAHGSVPSEIRRVLQHVDQEISQAFPNARYNAMGGFLFLRFICPGMLAPHAYGLLPAPPHPTAQRQIILIAKVLQNLANGTMPGVKEEYMERMNTFISNNQAALESFFDKLIQNDGPVVGPTIPEAVKWNALIDIYGIVSNYHQQIDQYLQTVEGGDEIRAQLNTILQAGPISRKGTRSNKADV